MSRNLASSVTGGLLFSEQCFAQILEGPQAAVDEIYGSIVQDKRHTGITLLNRTTVGERLFPSWSMAFAAPGSNVTGGSATLPAFYQQSAAGDVVLTYMQTAIVDWKARWSS